MQLTLNCEGPRFDQNVGKVSLTIMRPALRVRDGLPEHPTHADIMAMQECIERAPTRMDPAPHEDHFAEGVYGRILYLTAGTALAGRMHRKSCINILLSGRIVVWSEKEGRREVEGPCVFSSPGGVKRIGACLTDVAWMTCHANPDNITDPDALVAMLAYPEPGPTPMKPAIEGEAK